MGKGELRQQETNLPSLRVPCGRDNGSCVVSVCHISENTSSSTSDRWGSCYLIWLISYKRVFVLGPSRGLGLLVDCPLEQGICSLSHQREVCGAGWFTVGALRSYRDGFMIIDLSKESTVLRKSLHFSVEQRDWIRRVLPNFKFCGHLLNHLYSCQMQLSWQIRRPTQKE